jgi:hypothetical protein
LSEDPMSYRAGGSNLYAYCHNSLVILVDPCGLQEQSNFNFPPGLSPGARAALEARVRANGGVTRRAATQTPRVLPSAPYSAAADPANPAFDADAVTMLHNWSFLVDFLTGSGETNRFYGPDTIQTFQMRQSPGAAKLRDAFYAGGCKDIKGGPSGEYGTWAAARDTVLGPVFSGGGLTNTATQVGGFAGATAINNGDGTVTFTIPNTAGMRSFLFHAVPNRTGTAGPMRTIQQTFQWTENIDKSRCCPSPTPPSPLPPPSPPPSQ